MQHDGDATILVVDDTPDQRDVMSILLRQAGFRVFTAENGSAGFEVAQAKHPLLVISDVMMPEVNGIELCRRLRADSNLHATPILLVSAMRVDDQSAVEGLQAGADDYLEAPYDPMRLIAKVTRLTERARFEEALRESEERYALAARGANDGLWDWRLKSNEIYFSARWKSMLGYAEDEIGNRPEEWFSRVHPDETEALEAEIAEHTRGESSHFEMEHRMLHKDGTYRWMLSRGIVVRDEDGRASRMAGSQSDITERKQAEEQLLHDAFHDALTGLPNRALFMDRLSQAVERVKRHPDCSFGVIFLDLDRFKVINDSLGHMVGDQLLVEISRRLEGCIRTGDTLARLGGDEFTIILDGVKETADAVSMADRIQEQLHCPFNLDNHEVQISASIGIALSTLSHDKPEDILRDTNIAMHRAKSSGKARHQVFDTTMHFHALELLRLETELRRTAEGEEYCVHYQPLVSLETGQLTGFEALVRWQHPERGFIYPEEFVAVAEETGLIISLDRWVLREACWQVRAWQRQFPEQQSLTVSVNFSARQFSQPDLVEHVQRVLKETGLDAGCLKLEITESVFMSSAESVTALLRRLKGIGVEIHLDDFGTGYSSLSYLHRFPIDVLKIDRSFVTRIGAEGENAEIARAIVTMAHSLGMKVVAEGIETESQFAELKSLSCEYGQGHLFSKPVEALRAEKLLTNLSGQKWLSQPGLKASHQSL
ncbi:MAG TPA: EAL domain-containing protein [Pyrinomonadaceae bacterium]|jgi:diguanylate cyclase (GGDEF)-like protein/PAS domain S-box-containing protein|nr:EAL domain-containing protein [Pyrinomonadaceae bacterium]